MPTNFLKINRCIGWYQFNFQHTSTSTQRLGPFQKFKNYFGKDGRFRKLKPQEKATRYVGFTTFVTALLGVVAKLVGVRKAYREIITSAEDDEEGGEGNIFTLYRREKKKEKERRNMIGNGVGQGLAWLHYADYLQHALPDIRTHIEDSEWYKQLSPEEQMRIPMKLYEVIPRKCYLDVTGTDDNIQLEAEIVIACKKDAIVSNKNIKIKIYSIKDGQTKFYCMCNCPNELTTMNNVNDIQKAGISQSKSNKYDFPWNRKSTVQHFTVDTKLIQLMRFYYTLSSLLCLNNNADDYRDKARLILFNESDQRLSTVLLQAIKEDLKVDSSEKKPNGAVINMKLLAAEYKDGKYDFNVLVSNSKEAFENESGELNHSRKKSSLKNDCSESDNNTIKKDSNQKPIGLELNMKLLAAEYKDGKYDFDVLVSNSKEAFENDSGNLNRSKTKSSFRKECLESDNKKLMADSKDFFSNQKTHRSLMEKTLLTAEENKDIFYEYDVFVTRRKETHNKKLDSMTDIQVYDKNGEVIEVFDEQGKQMSVYDREFQPMTVYDKEKKPIEVYDNEGTPMKVNSMIMKDINDELISKNMKVLLEKDCIGKDWLTKLKYAATKCRWIVLLDTNESYKDMSSSGKVAESLNRILEPSTFFGSQKVVDFLQSIIASKKLFASQQVADSLKSILESRMVQTVAIVHEENQLHVLDDLRWVTCIPFQQDTNLMNTLYKVVSGLEIKLEKSKEIYVKPGEVAVGLAWAYAANHLNKILPLVSEEVKEAHDLNIPLPDNPKLFIIVPESCKTEEYLSEKNPRQRKQSSTGNMYEKIVVYSVRTEDNEPARYFVGEYARLVEVIRQMEQNGLLNKEQMKEEVKTFYTTVDKIMKILLPEKTENYEFVFYNDVTTTLKDELLEKYQNENIDKILRKLRCRMFDYIAQF